MGPKEFIQHLKRQQGNRSLREFATSLGVSAAYLSDIYLGRRSPGLKIASALGYTCLKTKIVSIKFIRRKAA